MSAEIINGKTYAKSIYETIKPYSLKFLEQTGRLPSLHVILVGDDPASATYVRNKEIAARKIGIECVVHRYHASIKTIALMTAIQELNADSRVDAIMVQLPLPDHIDKYAVLDSIDVRKDPDRLGRDATGFLYSGEYTSVAPCTAQAVMLLVKKRVISGAGKSAVVIGRSSIVGIPTAYMLTKEDFTVTLCHSKTANLKDFTSRADVLVVAAGVPNLVTGDMIKPGAVVIDVGINHLPDGTLVGDVDFESAKEVAGAITPVPGGVGPLTVAELMTNTISLAFTRLELI